MSKTTHKKTILIMAGGTGGDIFSSPENSKEIKTPSFNI
jgi:hypothetical protein